tara:strand:- start:91 stop:270 length:180 start_codon:yes stop_codon:yes gene_type:complete
LRENIMRVVTPDPCKSALSDVLKELYLLKIGMKNENYEGCMKKIDLIRSMVTKIINTDS